VFWAVWMVGAVSFTCAVDTFWISGISSNVVMMIRNACRLILWCCSVNYELWIVRVIRLVVGLNSAALFTYHGLPNTRGGIGLCVAFHLCSELHVSEPHVRDWGGFGYLVASPSQSHTNNVGLGATVWLIRSVTWNWLQIAGLIL